MTGKELTIALPLKTAFKVMIVSTLLGTAIFAQTNCQSAEELEFGRKFTREEQLLLNLAHGQGSAGFFLLEALRTSKETTHNIERAMSQMRQVEATYGKSKGRPDDKFFPNAELKLTQARQSSEQVTENVSDGFREMKRAVKDTLIRNP